MRLTGEDLEEIAKFFINKIEEAGRKNDRNLKTTFIFGPCIRKVITESNWDPDFDVVYINVDCIDFSKLGLTVAYNMYTGSNLGYIMKVNGKKVIIKRQFLYNLGDYYGMGLPRDNKELIGNYLLVSLQTFLEEESFDVIVNPVLKQRLLSEINQSSVYDIPESIRELEIGYNLLIDGYFINNFSCPENARRIFTSQIKKSYDSSMDTIRNLRICALNSRYYSKICDIILTIPIPPDLIDTPYKNWKYFTESIKRLDELYSDRDRVILRLLLYIVHGGDSYHVDEFLSWAVGLKKEYKSLLKNLKFVIYEFHKEWDKKKTPISAISRKIYRVLYRKNLLDYFEEYIEPIMHVCYGLELKDLKEINNNIEKLTIDQVKLPVTGEDIQKYIKYHPYNFNNIKDNHIIGNINKYLLDLYDENPKMTREDLLDEMKNIKL